MKLYKHVPLTLLNFVIWMVLWLGILHGIVDPLLSEHPVVWKDFVRDILATFALTIVAEQVVHQVLLGGRLLNDR